MAQRLLAVVAALNGGRVRPRRDSHAVRDDRIDRCADDDGPNRQRDKMTGPAPADLEVNHLAGFVAPSGNVSCMIDVDWARCDIMDRDWSPPPRPADCEWDYGQGISIASGEQAHFVCAGDTAFGMDAVLPYGESIAAGVPRCESAESGITCRDLRTGHGFSLAREAYQLF